MTIIVENFESQALVGNALGDPTVRQVPVYLPPSYDQQPDRRYPVVYMLHGFTGNSASWLNVNSFYTPTVPERFERLIEVGGCGEMILVFPDGYTSLGGSQYVNSSATGHYEDYLVSDLVNYIDGKYRTLGTEGRGVAGKSSGGFGAVRLALRHPDVFRAFASHAGDMYFEYCYKPDFPKAVNGLARFENEPDPIKAFLTAFAETESKGNMVETLNILAMAACYSPVGNTFELPFDLHTGELWSNVWDRWLDFDPVYMLEQPEYLQALKDMKGAYLDAGTRDEYNLHLGARVFVAHATAKGATVHHEEFEAGHMGISYRYDVSLPFLWNVLKSQ